MTMSTSSRRRPKRQRTPTTLYTDDNPSTFTTKHRKGDPVEPEVKPPKPSYFFVEEDVIESPDASKRPNRRRKPYHKDDMLETTTAERLEAISQEKEALAAAAAAVPSSQPIKRKRGRPPKIRTSPQHHHHQQQDDLLPLPPTPTTPSNLSVSSDLAEIPAADSQASIPQGVSADSSSKPQHLNPHLKEDPQQQQPPTPHHHTWTPPIHDQEGIFLSHPTRVAPILPAILDSSGPTATDLLQSCPKVFGNGLGKTAPLATPQWKPLYQPDVYFDEDYDDALTLSEDLTPVTRSITCMTTRKPDHAYMVVGDSMGFCIVYSLETIIRPVARLESVACQQRALAEQEKIREQQRRNRKSLVMDTSTTTIHALGMTANRVILATALELECMDVPSQTSLWVCPLAQDRLVTSLDMHPSRYDVLVSCSLFDDATMLGQSSPLMLLQHSQNNVEVCDANAPVLLRSPCCTAIWDNSKNVEDRLLFVAVANDELELVLVQGGSIDSWKVACKTRIPIKNSNHATRLSQSDDGTYTLVASSRGIRLYQTETLQLIHVYGDQLALHGKSIVWRDCFFVGKGLPAKQRSALGKDASGNLTCDDWVKIRDKEPEAKDQEISHPTTDELGQYVIGVPNHKGPKELTETLHVWKVEHASVVPALTIPLPPKSDGIQGVVAAPGKVPGVDDRLVMVGRNGEGHTLLPLVQSNFAGIMYPPGYQVITDNIEFIEEEAELDHVVDAPHQSSPSDGRQADEEADVDVLGEEDADLDEDLREAMRQSLLEQKLEQERQAMKDADVDVVGPISDDSSTEPSLIPCRPEVYLRQAINSGTDDEEEDENVATLDESTPLSSEHNSMTTNGHANSSFKVSLDPKVFVSNILSAVGHANPKKKEGAGEFSFSVTAKVVIATTPTQISSASVGNRSSAAGRHPKRSRAANLEAMMKASIDPRLQRYMFSKQSLGVNGKGSRLEPTKRKPTTKPQEQETRSQDSGVLNGGQGHETSKENTGSANGSLLSVLGLTKSDSDLLNSRFRSDEAAVALGLLGLSPTPTPDPEASDASRTSSLNAQSLNHLGPSGSSGRADSTFGGSDRDSEADSSKLQMRTGKASPKMDPSCLACCGRFVIHSCGKRALPIDYDEVAKLERERKQKEEEEKKRIRAEKRRLADQRRREARKQKQRELEEQRRREEDEIRMEKERLRRMEDARNNTSFQTQAEAPSGIDLDRQRREMIVASYANHLSHVHETQDWQKGTAANAVTPSAMEINAVDYNQRQASVPAAEAEQTVASPPSVAWERVGAIQAVAAPAPAPAAPAPVAASEAYAAYNGANARLAEVHSSMAATFSSADALVALAGLAGIAKRELPEQPTTNGQPSYATYERSPPSYASTAPTISHGFGASALPISVPKRAIPSFAAIRGQMEVQEQPASRAAQSFLSYEPIKPAPSAAAAAIAAVTAAAAETNGGHATPASATYVWPPRTDVEGRFYTREDHQAAPSTNWPPSAS